MDCNRLVLSQSMSSLLNLIKFIRMQRQTCLLYSNTGPKRKLFHEMKVRLGIFNVQTKMNQRRVQEIFSSLSMLEVGEE